MCYQFKKISIHLSHKVFWCAPYPLKVQVKLNTFYKTLTFANPLPLEIFNGLPWGGCGYSLEPHNENP